MECNFYNKIQIFYMMSVEWDVKLDFEEEYASGGRQGNFKISKLITFN